MVQKLTAVKFVISLLLVTTAITVVTYRKALSLFPTNETFFEFSTVMDSSSAVADYDSAHGHLHFRYTLYDDNSAPLLLFHAHELARNINLSKYEYLYLETDPLDNTDFMVTLFMFIPGISDPVDMSTHRPYSFKCRADSSRSSFRLNIKDFATPTYWYSFMNLRENELPETDWSMMTHMAFADFSGKPLNTPQQIAFSDIHFGKSLFNQILQSSLIALCVVSLLFFTLSLLRKRKNRSIKTKIYGSKTEIVTPEQSKGLLLYIEKNYSDPFFTLEKVEKELSLNQYQVNIIVKSEFEMGYKQYLNKMRMDEAKRLLKSTDLSIAAIGKQVGYIHSNSFARTFKNCVGTAPNIYRRETQKQ